MECKNCGKQTKNDNVYCSYTCRNIYVNKNLRDYNKLKKTNEEKKRFNEEKYYENPKKCLFCDTIIKYENKKNNFCDSSCSASFNNKKNVGRKHNFSEKGLNSILEGINNKHNIDEYYKEPVLCLNCSEVLMFSKRKHKFCNNDCKKEYFSKNLKEFDMYKSLSRFKFDLKEYNNEFDFNLINEYGWYKAKNNGDNVEGVSRDHMFSVKEGFRNLINPLLISHPANCELILNKKNQSKSDKCSLNIDELLEKIDNFEIKYGKYYEYEIKTHINYDELKEMYINSNLK